jgi:hypothetical protein
VKQADASKDHSKTVQELEPLMSEAVAQNVRKPAQLAVSVAFGLKAQGDDSGFPVR